MSNGKQETIAYIIKEARGVFDELLKHGYKVVSVDRMADIIDRIEEAHKREMADEKRISDAVVQSLRDKKLEMAGEIAAKDAEVSALRALVGEMADELLAACDDTCDYCKKHLNIGDASALICLYNRQCNVGQAYGRLVAKAREVVK